jgi:4-amino-4-deoxy-L-arabinose transferase-like glycosyltransferase
MNMQNDRTSTEKILRWGLMGLAVVLLLFLAFTNLTRYPVIWYDEGSHLHVPKTLVTLGKYADLSSEGFRYYGPVIGVGPTVMLPIALSFKIFGIGLLQARVVMALYLLATIALFFGLSRWLGGTRIAIVATALIVTCRAVGLLEYGREVLGEVAGFSFVVAAVWIWFTQWEKPKWHLLALAGLLMGLATITKNQYLLVLVPAVGLAWLVNLFYYRLVPGRFFVVPGIVMIGCYGLWQVFLVLSLGPSGISENLATLRAATAGAAFVFSPTLMKHSLGELLKLRVYLGWLFPALAYGFYISLPRKRDGLLWGIVWMIIFSNLLWYVTASVGWVRYAFPGLAFSSLFVARLFADMLDQFDPRPWWSQLQKGLSERSTSVLRPALKFVLLAWLAVMVIVPLGQNLKDIVFPPFNAPAAMTEYMNANIPTDAVVETWEVEMGFLTNHQYHYPPQILLDTAVGYIWRGGPSPATKYDFTAQNPEYVLDGQFAQYVALYPQTILDQSYKLIYQVGPYRLYQHNK